MQPNQPSQFQIILKQIWPTIHRVITGTVYFILNLIKSIIKMSIDQIQGSF
jgi:hypothetical protein